MQSQLLNTSIYLCFSIDSTNQKEIDNALIELDGTKNKSRLGANAILATSLACARVSAKFQKLPLYKYIGGIKK